MEADKPRVVHPVKEIDVDHPFQYKNLGHAQNSCYIAATISACFVTWDAWDAIFSPPTGNSNEQTEILRDALRNVVNGARDGMAVPCEDVEKLRSAMVNRGFPGGKRQEDATDFFSALLEYLDAPLVPLHEELFHYARRDQDDVRRIGERLIWLPLLDAETRFEALLWHVFFGEELNIQRIGSNNQQQVVDARRHRTLIPEYTPSAHGQLLNQRNSLDVVTLPFALTRYGNDLQKNRTPIFLPLTLNFNHYVRQPLTPVEYTAQLRSVVSHRGSEIGQGHYVSFTHDANGWRRWDDMGATNVELSLEAEDGLPRNEKWREEILQDSYLVLYGLVPRRLHGTSVNPTQAGTGISSNPAHYYSQLLGDARIARELDRDERRRAELDRARQIRNQVDRRANDYDQVQNDAQYAEQVARDEEERAERDRANLELALRIEMESNARAVRDNQVQDDEQYAKQVARDEEERVERDRADLELALRIEMESNAKAVRDSQIQDDAQYAKQIAQEEQEREDAELARRLESEESE